MPLQKNQLLTLRIERLSSDGSGVAHSADGEAGSVTRDVSSGLCPGSSPWTVGMYDTTDHRKTVVQYQMGLCIRRRI